MDDGETGGSLGATGPQPVLGPLYETVLGGQGKAVAHIRRLRAVLHQGGDLNVRNLQNDRGKMFKCKLMQVAVGARAGGENEGYERYDRKTNHLKTVARGDPAFKLLMILGIDDPGFHPSRRH